MKLIETLEKRKQAHISQLFDTNNINERLRLEGQIRELNALIYLLGGNGG